MSFCLGPCATMISDDSIDSDRVAVYEARTLDPAEPPKFKLIGNLVCPSTFRVVEPCYGDRILLWGREDEGEFSSERLFAIWDYKSGTHAMWNFKPVIFDTVCEVRLLVNDSLLLFTRLTNIYLRQIVFSGEMILLISLGTIQAFTIAPLTANPEQTVLDPNSTTLTVTLDAKDIVTPLPLITFDFPPDDPDGDGDRSLYDAVEFVLPAYWHHRLHAPFLFDAHLVQSTHTSTGTTYTSTIRRYQLHLEMDPVAHDTVCGGRVELLRIIALQSPLSMLGYHAIATMDFDSFDPQSSHFFLRLNVPDEEGGDASSRIAIAIQYTIGDPEVGDAGNEGGTGENMDKGMLTTFHRYPMGPMPNWSLCPVSGRMVETRFVGRGVDEVELYEYYLHDFLT